MSVMKEEKTPLKFEKSKVEGHKDPNYGLTITMAVFFIVGEMAGSGILALPQ